MARKTGRLIARGSRTRLVGIALDRGLEIGTRKYQIKAIRGSFRKAQTYLNAKLQESRDLLLPLFSRSRLNVIAPRSGRFMEPLLLLERLSVDWNRSRMRSTDAGMFSRFRYIWPTGRRRFRQFSARRSPCWRCERYRDALE
jgi:hypothetical protein